MAAKPSPACQRDPTRKAKDGKGSFIELVVIVVVALGLALGIQAFLVKPFRIPSESMVPTLEVGQRVLVDRVVAAVRRSRPRRHRRLQAAARRRRQRGGPVREARSPTRPATPPWTSRSETNFIKRVVGVPGDELYHPGRPRLHEGQDGRFRQQKEPFIRPDSACDTCNLRKPIKVPPGHFFMMGDNRGKSDDSRVWGPVPKNWIIGGAFFTYWPPKRIGTLVRSARADARLFAFDRSFERRFVAGADEAGRGCLAGPLVAAAVLFDIERLTLSDRRALARLNDSKQHTEAGREELYPLVLRAAAKSSIVVRCVRGIDSRGPPRHEPRGAAHRARGASPARTRSASSTASGCPTSATSSGRWSTATRRARRSRRRRCSRRSRATATCGAIAERHPGGSSRRTSATRRPSTAPRSASTASRRSTACRSRRSPTSSSRSTAERRARIRTRPPGGRGRAGARRR